VADPGAQATIGGTKTACFSRLRTPNDGCVAWSCSECVLVP